MSYVCSSRKVMMRKLPEVERARELMNEAMAWSVVKWLREKKRVRKTADEANAALDHLNQAVKEGWSEELRVAYKELVTQADAQGKQQSQVIDPEVTLFARTVKKADEAASRARMDAENTFDEAERQLSTSLAREGCRKAIYSWDLHEKAIGKAEAPICSSKP
jgi:hypothetical protein